VLGLARGQRAQSAGDIGVSAKPGVARQAIGEFLMAAGDIGQFGEQMSKLGEQQGKLGEQEAMLGEQQRKIIEDVRRQLKPLIEQAIREGKGKLIWED